jgi:hypothetical protein
VSRFARSSIVALLALFALPVAADVAPLVDCPWYGNGGDQFANYGFYVPRYPGSSLKTVTMPLLFPAAGTYSLSLAAHTSSYSGALVGTATTNVVVTAGNLNTTVTFNFGSPAVASGSLLAFQGAIVSAPASSIYMVTLTPAGCPVIQTEGTTPPLGTYRRNGIAVVITGDPDSSTNLQTTTVPSVASIHGQNGAFFHTDLWLFNRLSDPVTVTARYRCLTGLACGSGTATFTIGSFAAKTITDAVPTLFGANESAGALELTVNSRYPDGLYTLSRTYSPALPAATTGASLVALPASAANGDAVFVGLAGSGGDLSTGFRTNVGVYNPQETATTVFFELHRVDGSILGSTSLALAAHEARQINDIFAATGVGGVIATDAYLFVSANVPIFGFATVIDNRTGDFVYQGTTKFF